MKMAWRLGWPGWKFAASCGLPIEIRIDVCHDKEANVYFAVNSALGLAVEAESLDELMKEIQHAVFDLLKLAHSPVQNHRTDIRLHDACVIA